MWSWLADIFRLYWALIYWNTRKSWFSLRRGRVACPCQAKSDSGRAYETRCEASITWNRAGRFHRVCPYLQHAPGGLFCGANTSEVRPFWGRAARIYGITLLSIYLTGAVGVFVVLRTIGYPVSIVHITWPGLWYRVPQTRAGYFIAKSDKAFIAGDTRTGLIALSNAYDFDPGNLAIGLKLARYFQLLQPQSADQFYQRLMREHADKANDIAQEWFRALLSRGDFPNISRLAAEQVLKDEAGANVWMRALIFATRQTKDDKPLRTLFDTLTPAAQRWRPVLASEIMLRNNRPDLARNTLRAQWPDWVPPYAIFYQAHELATVGDAPLAADLLTRNANRLDLEARTTAELDIFAASRADAQRRTRIAGLLDVPISLPRVKILCAHLVRYPSAELFSHLYAVVEQSNIPLNNDTAAEWFSLFCTAGAVGDVERQHIIGEKLRAMSSGRNLLLSSLEAFFRGDTSSRRIATLLPALPVPMEMTYALLERYPGGVVQPVKRPQ